MQTLPPADELASRNLDLLNQVRETVVMPLADDFAWALDGLGQGLFREADSAPAARQKDYLDAIQELRREREPIIARFRAHLAKAWQALESGRPLSVERTLARGNDLTLVAADELEVRLAVRSLAGAIQQRWRPELMRLDRYLGWIAGGLRLNGDNNPVGPEHLGVAVYAAFSGLRIAPCARLAAVRLCEGALVTRVGALYEVLEQCLIALTRETDLPSGRTRRRGIPRAGQAPAAPAEDWIGRFFSHWQGARGAAPVAAGLDAHVRDDRELLPPGLRGLLQAARGGHRAAGEGDACRTLSPRELSSVLSLLQTNEHAGFDQVDAAGDLVQGLHQQVLAQAATLGIDPASVRLDPADRDGLDLVAMLFAAMLDQSVLTPDIRPVLGQLLVPVAKVALQDPRLFVRDSHPVRRLLNLLAEACDGNPGESAAELALLAQVRAAAGRIVEDFDEHLGVFLAAETEFAAYYEQYRRRVEIAERRAAELQRAEERRVQARTRAAEELERRVGGVALLPALEGFLRRPWTQQVERAALRAEGDSPALHDALALADGLLRAHAAAGAGTPEAAAWLESQHPQLQRAYAEAGLPGAAAEAAATALRDALLGRAATGAVAAPELPPPPESQVPAADEAASPLPDEPPEALGFDVQTVEYFQALPLGTWLDFVDRHGRTQPGKLSWVSPISGRRMFVNRRGARFCLASPEQLAAMVRLGRLRLHREEDAFYSAMQDVLDRLEEPGAAV
ncbi:hypothetical protein B1992_07740 [Pseudoxanthomonas broegbernensis]|uniref:DUF1631 domain-containing protein n=1 Tax=Pseudoxanthomonas broegbernensis TaxID=83619 RepID=A0A7V8GMF2_9GAMM|nr:DUF1631 family protein [Pseudoxanthomonas broegbernensis]KAF1686437.1 hypothetical protein B1992_07740 [Pseudoxanthomonas broegbernensis]MBB6064312.1 hypothetical protein [Pseudoxanthomonas broegbernensis]